MIKETKRNTLCLCDTIKETVFGIKSVMTDRIMKRTKKDEETSV